MKALTVKQPWADLIVIGQKDIENRTWKTNFRGRIYIHAGQRIAEVYPAILPLSKEFDPVGMELAKILSRREVTSAIIGEVDIIDCVQNHPSEWAEKGVWNWVLANPVKYDEPILNVKGAQSFWEYTPVNK